MGAAAEAAADVHTSAELVDAIIKAHHITTRAKLEAFGALVGATAMRVETGSGMRSKPHVYMERAFQMCAK